MGFIVTDPNRLERKTFYSEKGKGPWIYIQEYTREGYNDELLGYWINTEGDSESQFYLEKEVLNFIKKGIWSKTKRMMKMTEARKKLAAEGSGKLGKGTYKKSEVMAYLDENNIEWEGDPFKPLKIKIRYSDYLLHKTFLQRYLVELFLGNAYIQQN